MSKKRDKNSRATYVVPTGPTDPARVITESGRVIEHSAAPAPCELCGAVEELRPYGPGGKRICFACGMKDEKRTKRAFGRQFKR